MEQIIKKSGVVKCVTTVPYSKETIKAMKKAGYTVTERRTGRGQANSRAGTNDNPPPGGAEAHDRKRSRQEECQLQ